MQSVINNRDRARQIIDFGGMKYGEIYPTDIDGCIEYRNKAVILFEMKYRTAEMPFGQKLALQRIADSIRKAGKDSIIFLCSHNVYNCEEDVDAASTVIKEIYWRGRWRKVTDGRTLGTQVRKYLDWINSNPI